MGEAQDQQRASAGYRLDADGTVRRLIEGVHWANGMCFSIDGRIMYFTDVPTGRILD